MADDYIPLDETSVPLPDYQRGAEHWPLLWRLPADEAVDSLDALGDKLACIVDDITLRETIHVWDNAMRIDTPEARAGICTGVLAAHARLSVSLMPDDEPMPLEQVADLVRETWLQMAKQSLQVKQADSWDVLRTQAP